jgi:hypothetical protein
VVVEADIPLALEQAALVVAVMGVKLLEALEQRIQAAAAAAAEQVMQQAAQAVVA